MGPAPAPLGEEGAVEARPFDAAEACAGDAPALKDALEEVLGEVPEAALGCAAVTGEAPTTLGDLERFWRAAFMAATFFCHSSISNSCPLTRLARRYREAPSQDSRVLGVRQQTREKSTATQYRSDRETLKGTERNCHELLAPGEH